jgi:hypothetical protein
MVLRVVGNKYEHTKLAALLNHENALRLWIDVRLLWPQQLQLRSRLHLQELWRELLYCPFRILDIKRKLQTNLEPEMMDNWLTWPLSTRANFVSRRASHIPFCRRE